MPSGHQVQHCQPLIKNPSTHFVESVRVSTHYVHKQVTFIHEKFKKKTIFALCATYTVNMIIFPVLKKITCTKPVSSINKQLSIADSKQVIYNQ
jgi:hypothetical protein